MPSMVGYSHQSRLDYRAATHPRLHPAPRIQMPEPAHNTTLNADGSTDIGLAQINDRSWCLPTRWYPAGYLQTLGKINYCKDLFDPYLNLVAAKALYDYAEKTNGNGFTPWGK